MAIFPINSKVQASNFFFFIFLASKKLLAPQRGRIGTGSVFCHSFSVSPGVIWVPWSPIGPKKTLAVINQKTQLCSKNAPILVLK